jgi:hypothetical protein
MKRELAVWHPGTSHHKFLYLVKITSSTSGFTSVSYTISFAKSNILGADTEMPNPSGKMRVNDRELWRGHRVIKNIFEVEWA